GRKWARHMGLRQHAPRKALGLGVGRVLADVREEEGVGMQPLIEQLLPPGERLGLVGNRSAFDNAVTRGLSEIRSQQVRIRRRQGAMFFEVPVRRVDRLPEPVQIRLAVGRASRFVGSWTLSLSDDRRY